MASANPTYYFDETRATPTFFKQWTPAGDALAELDLEEPVSRLWENVVTSTLPVRGDVIVVRAVTLTHAIGTFTGPQLNEANTVTSNNSRQERLLRISAATAVTVWLVLFALMALNVVHWLAWVPGLIACSGAVITLGSQLNRLTDGKGPRGGTAASH